MKSDSAGDLSPARLRVVLATMGLIVYSASIGTAIYRNHESTFWTNLFLPTAWKPSVSGPMAIICLWSSLTACFFFLSSVIIFCLRASSIASPNTPRLKLALVAAVLVIAAFTAWTLVQIAHSSDVGEFGAPNLTPCLAVFAGIYFASLLGLLELRYPVYCLFVSRSEPTFIRRVFIATLVVVLTVGLFWGLLGSAQTISDCADYVRAQRA